MERNYFDRPLTSEDLLEFKLKKEKYDNSKVYTSEKDFVFIHKTNYAPNENNIKSTFESGAKYDEKGTRVIDGLKRISKLTVKLVVIMKTFMDLTLENMQLLFRIR